MCGIVAVIGSREAAPLLLEGLRQLEYRGYDSAGIATVAARGALTCLRAEGKLVNLTNRWSGAKKVRPNTFEIWFGDKDLPPICTGKQVTLQSPPPVN